MSGRLHAGRTCALRSPTVTIPAIVPWAAIVCVWTPIPRTVITGSVVTRSISAIVGRSVAVRRGVAAVITRGIAAIITVIRSAIVAVTRAIGVGAGGDAPDHRASN